MINKVKYKSFDIFLIVFKLLPIVVITQVLLIVVSSVFSTIGLSFLLASFIETVQNMKNHTVIIQSLTWLLLCIGICKIVDPLQLFLETKIKLALEKTLLPIIVKKQAILSYKYIEDQKCQELMDRLTSELVETFIEGMQGYYSILKSILVILSMSLLVLINVWWASLIILIGSIPLFISSLYLGKRNYNAKVASKTYERRYSYYSEEILTNREAVDEKTLFSYTDSITDQYYLYFEKSRDIQLKVLFQTKLMMKLTGIVLLVISFFTLIPLVYHLVDNKLNIGLFMGIVATLFNFAETLGLQLQLAIKNISETEEYMNDLNYLLSLESNTQYCDLPSVAEFDFETLEFKNVWFKYPNTDNYILKGISFVIEKNKTYVFVGINGSGKTTITKLMIGLYTDYEGQILINGKELRTYDCATLKSLYASVFQDYAKYQISLKDNIQLGDINKTITDVELNDVDLSVFVNELENREDTLLGKLFTDSRELSGGQWQRIAIARCLYSNAPFKILDEPVASLDPIMEHFIYQKFQKLMANKTCVLISHRLGIAKLSDTIFLLENGIIAEKGTHKQLLELNRTYALMFNEQKEWYQ